MEAVSMFFFFFIFPLPPGVCPYGFAWVDSPRGDLNHDGVIGKSGSASHVTIAAFGSDAQYEYELFANDAATGKVALANEGHFYSECSNKGMCDRVTGECACYDGYTGSSCQRTVCPNDCSGSGDCVADPITGAGVCSCYYGFSGTTCSSVDSLDFFDCG